MRQKSLALAKVAMPLLSLATLNSVIDAPLSNLRSLLVEQCQPGVQLHQDG